MKMTDESQSQGKSDRKSMEMEMETDMDEQEEDDGIYYDDNYYDSIKPLYWNKIKMKILIWIVE